MYSLSLPGAHQLKNEEGLRLKAYYCAAGKLTIGYGHRLVPGEPLEITKEQAEGIFTSDTARFLQELWNDKKDLAQHEVDALCSFIFNIGIGAWHGSTCRRDLLQGLKPQVPYEMKRWIKDDHGHAIAGLVSRRAREAKLFAEGVYA